MSALLTADWFQLGSYYRKFDLYSMNWSISEGLENMVVCGAAYGGPIAVVRDRKQLVRVVGHAKPVITIYNGVGNVISKFMWNSGVLVHMGWSDAEQLLCVQESGDVLIYDMFGTYQKTFNLGQEVRDTKVWKAQFFPNPNGIGLGVITTSNRMFLINNVSEPKIRSVPDLPRANEPITSWCVLSTGTRASPVIGFLVCRDKEVYKCQMGENRAVLMRPEISSAYTQILAVVPSQNGRHVALYTDSGILWLGSSDFRNKYCEVDTSCIKQLKELVWCGSQAVAVHWADTLALYGPTGVSVSYPYDGPFHVIPEPDCIRVVSDVTHEMIQRVPPPIESIFRINSTAPGSYLVEASKQFQRRSHKADEYIRLVRAELPAAVQECVDAAAADFDPDVQKTLIRAAQYGKGFLSDLALTESYVSTCRWLRVLNAVRNPKVAMPITYLQVQTLTSRVLLDRLIWRRLHCLASLVADCLQIKDGRTRVASHWACYKVTQPNCQAREICDKLRGVPGACYAAVAVKAAEQGRKALAIQILEYETRSKLQVPLLLSLGEGPTALLKATASGDTDLVYVVLLHLKEKMGKHEFELTVRGFPLAHALYIKYCAQHNREALRQVYTQVMQDCDDACEDNFEGEAATHLREALEQPAAAEAAYAAARECYRRARQPHAVAICEDFRKLCKQQASLQETYGEGFCGEPLQATVKKLLLRGELKLADKLRAEYKMPDRRYWWLRVLALAERGEWPELDKLSRSKRPPCGFEPFVDACVRHARRDEALRYLPRCRDDVRVKYYVKAGFYEEAAAAAVALRDPSALQYVLHRCPPRDPAHARVQALAERGV